MKCAAVRQRLLASESPEQPGAEMARHLQSCRSCQTWQSRLILLEDMIPQLTVPESVPPVSLMDRLRTVPPPVPASAPPPVPLVIRPRPEVNSSRRSREGGRQKLALAFSLAASLAIFSLCWWAWPTLSPRPRALVQTNPYQTRLDQFLRASHTPEDRVNKLADLASEFVVEARRLHKQPQRLVELATHFDRLVHHDLMRLAREVPASSRVAVLNEVAKRFRAIESEASRLESELVNELTTSVTSIRQIAQTAREADRRLRMLAKV